MNQPQTTKRSLAILVLLFAASFFWLGFAWRFVSLSALLVGWILYFKRKSSIRPTLVALSLFVPLTLSPIDVQPIHRRWPPRVVPLVMGLPTAQTVERAKRGEQVLGGCIVTGGEPKYYLVW